MKDVFINSKSIIDFFERRVQKDHGLYTTMLQDVGLAKSRNLEETKILESLFPENEKLAILDLGCGSGRLLQLFLSLNKIHSYVGIEGVTRLVEQLRLEHDPHVCSFYCVNLESDSIPSIQSQPDTVLLSGILLYLNDSAVKNILKTIVEIASEKSRIYIREPISILENRLVLNGHFSSELQDVYSACYRTEKELIERFFSILTEGGFVLKKTDQMYHDPNLNNRKETIQKYFYFEKVGVCR